MSDRLHRLPIPLTKFIGLQHSLQMLAVEAKKAGRKELAVHCFRVADEMDEWIKGVMPNG